MKEYQDFVNSFDGQMESISELIGCLIIRAKQRGHIDNPEYLTVQAETSADINKLINGESYQIPFVTLCKFLRSIDELKPLIDYLSQRVRNNE
jgi:hypothetical protein